MVGASLDSGGRSKRRPYGEKQMRLREVLSRLLRAVDCLLIEICGRPQAGRGTSALRRRRVTACARQRLIGSKDAGWQPFEAQDEPALLGWRCGAFLAALDSRGIS